MTSFEAEKERITRFYEFAQSDFRREINEDYPILCRTGSGGAIACVAALRTLPIDEQLEVANVLVKSSHKIALRLLSAPMTDEEQNIDKAFLEKQNRVVGSTRLATIPAWPETTTITLCRLKKELASRDLSKFGAKASTTSFNLCRKMEVGGWILSTYVNARVRGGTGVYDHEHNIKLKSAVMSSEERDIIGCYGWDSHERTAVSMLLCGFNPICWVASEEDIPGVVDGLIQTWEHFYAHVIPILEDIRI